MILSSKVQWQNSRVDLLAQEFVELGRIGPNDFLFISPYSIGDFYQTLMLMDAFRARHCQPGQKIHFICNKRCLPLATLFGNIEFCVGMDCGPHEFALNAFAERYPLAPGFPIVLEPDMHARGWLSRIVAVGKITQTEAKKLLLELDINTPLKAPKLNEVLREEVNARAQAQGLQPGSVIIFNHAQGIDPIDPQIFRVLGERFGDNIFYDATVNGAASVPWAKPLNIPLDDVPYYAEFAGNVVALRSGIVDVLSFTECNLVTIYPNGSMMRKVFTDPVYMAKLTRMARLEHLGIRPHRPEFTVLAEEEDDSIRVAHKLLKVIENLPHG